MGKKIEKLESASSMDMMTKKINEIIAMLGHVGNRVEIAVKIGLENKAKLEDMAENKQP